MWHKCGCASIWALVTIKLNKPADAVWEPGRYVCLWDWDYRRIWLVGTIGITAASKETTGLQFLGANLSGMCISADETTGSLLSCWEPGEPQPALGVSLYMCEWLRCCQQLQSGLLQFETPPLGRHICWWWSAQNTVLYLLPHKWVK